MNLLVQRIDIKRICEHPTKMNRSLVALTDGTNFEVEKPYEKMKELVVE